MAGAVSPNPAFSARFESFEHLEADTLDFLEQMPVYTKRDGSAVIFAFNSLFDLAWKLLKDSLTNWYGLDGIKPSPRDIIKTAATVDLIENETQWLAMLKNRNLCTHDYFGINQEYYCEVIRDEYLPLMQALKAKIASQLEALQQESLDIQKGDR